MYEVVITMKYTNWEKSAGGEWFGWRSLDGKITSNIESAINKDGKVEIFARGIDDAVLHNTQKSAGISHDWSGWNSLGGRITSDIKAEKNVDGRLCDRINTGGSLLGVIQLTSSQNCCCV